MKLNKDQFKSQIKAGWKLILSDEESLPRMGWKPEEKGQASLWLNAACFFFFLLLAGSMFFENPSVDVSPYQGEQILNKITEFKILMETFL